MPNRGMIFFLFTVSRPPLEHIHPMAMTTGGRGSFLGGKVSGSEIRRHISASNSQLKNTWKYTSNTLTQHFSFSSGCLQKVRCALVRTAGGVSVLHSAGRENPGVKYSTEPRLSLNGCTPAHYVGVVLRPGAIDRWGV
jgi:hypothetical protein